MASWKKAENNKCPFFNESERHYAFIVMDMLEVKGLSVKVGNKLILNGLNFSLKKA